MLQQGCHHETPGRQDRALGQSQGDVQAQEQDHLNRAEAGAMTQLSADPAMQAAKELSATLFSKPWVFIRGVPSLKFLPPEGPPEIAFAGRSNVGKSSLINALVGERACTDIEHAGPDPGAELFRSVGLLRRRG
jgi:ABC-type transport system involved in cytochrome bd biosynthesis fused ATPase/permease subunit